MLSGVRQRTENVAKSGLERTIHGEAEGGKGGERTSEGRTAHTRRNIVRGAERWHELREICRVAKVSASALMTMLYVLFAVDLVIGVVLCVGLWRSGK